MKLLYITLCGFFLWSLPVFAQESSPLEEVQHGRYLVLQNQIDSLQQRFNELQGIKTQVEDIISQVRDRPVENYGQEAEKYRELDALVPAAISYSEELARRQRQLDELQQLKQTLRAEVVDRRGTLPTWWVE